MDAVEIEVVEVGLRDGLQNLDVVMATADKCRWIAAEHAAGVREIEVGSFVPPQLLPQMADAGEVVAFARTLPGLTVAVLAPNLRGARDAIRAHVHKISIPVSVSPAHSLANVRKTPAEMSSPSPWLTIAVARSFSAATTPPESTNTTACGSRCKRDSATRPTDSTPALARRPLGY